MTTKFKIIAGFTIMIFLIGGMAALGYIVLQKSSNNLIDYRRQARLNAATSDLATYAMESVAKTYDYMSNHDIKRIESALQAIDSFLKLATIAEEDAKTPEHKNAFNSFKKLIEPMRDLETSIRANVIEIQNQYLNIVRPSYNDTSNLLNAIGSICLEKGNLQGLHAIAELWHTYSGFLATFERFASSMKEEDGKSALTNLNTLASEVIELERMLASPEARKVFSDFAKTFQTLKDAAVNMSANTERVRLNRDEMHRLEEELSTAIGTFNKKVDTGMHELGVANTEANNQAQTFILILSAVGVVLGAILAALIIIGIVRVLDELAKFAKAIAVGNFDTQVRIHEKGEIGNMVQSMLQIPVALKLILEDYATLEKSIVHGQLNAQGDPDKFEGGFATLIRGSNSIMERFLAVLESIPSPVVMFDKNLKAEYSNTIAREIAGSDYKGKTSFDLFAIADSGTSTDALKIAVETKRKASSESQARPQGKTFDISYTVIPLLDAGGQVASVLQLIVDQTAIKNQQRTMQEVASQASEISNRVATASEELSAQVEQVSRGAEVQHQRVESTASAMMEMNSTVLEVARNAGQASEQSELTRNKARDGAELVNKVVQSINQVEGVASAMQTNMKELGSQAESIGGVMNVISDIADQTNLLALNAAIEAARAGDAGRGFAVVADEVRKLAEKTMSATHEVGSNITAIQHSAKINIEAMADAVKAVADATNLANSSGAALTEIVDLASANSSVVASIATAAEEQSATSEEINRSISEINQVVAETTEGMIQSSSAVQELSHMAQELRRVMEGLR